MTVNSVLGQAALSNLRQATLRFSFSGNIRKFSFPFSLTLFNYFASILRIFRKALLKNETYVYFEAVFPKSQLFISFINAALCLGTEGDETIAGLPFIADWKSTSFPVIISPFINCSIRSLPCSECATIKETPFIKIS